MRSVDYLKRSEEVRAIADWIEPDRYIEENTRAAAIEAKAQLLRVAAMYEDLAALRRQIEHAMPDREMLDTFDELCEGEEFPEIEDFP